MPCDRSVAQRRRRERERPPAVRPYDIQTFALPNAPSPPNPLNDPGLFTQFSLSQRSPSPASSHRSLSITPHDCHTPSITAALNSEPMQTTENTVSPPPPSSQSLIRTNTRSPRRVTRRLSPATSSYIDTAPHSPSSVVLSARTLAQRRRRQRERSNATHSTPCNPTTVSTPRIVARRQRTLRHLQTAVGRRPFNDNLPIASFGRMSHSCIHCHALHWLDERTSGTPSKPQFGRCCQHGTVKIDRLPDLPDDLHTLFTGNSPQCRQFRSHIRQYNSALAFASFTANQEDVNTGGGGPWVWKNGYTLYHSSGGLLPRNDQQPVYLQLYFYDAHDALDFQMNRNPDLDQETSLNVNLSVISQSAF
ncbi:hypothetical protein BC826DRAFT_583570 [Russula brevipes]|nr:hypothetical protein BC826DRAFT_583570 [Russula brevipes]